MPSIKLQLLLHKIEATPGTDPTPTGAANAILVENLVVTPIDMAMQERQYALNGFARPAGIPAPKSLQVSFDVDFTPGATLGAAPAFGPLLRACGMSETLSAGVSATYAPLGGSFESETVYAWYDGVLHKGTFCRGNVQVEIQPGQVPKLKFAMMGLFKPVTDTARATPTYAGLLAPVVVSKAATAFQANAVQLVLNTLSFDAGVKTIFRDRPNAESIDIDDRQTSGSFTYHHVPVATFDVFGIAAAGTTYAVDLVHTVAAGRTAELHVAVAQSGKPTYGADGNQRTVVNPFDARDNGASPDFTLVFK